MFEGMDIWRMLLGLKGNTSTSEKDIFFTKMPRTEFPFTTLGKTTETFVGLSGNLPSCRAKFVDPIPNFDGSVRSVQGILVENSLMKYLHQVEVKSMA
jgi:hypothetical protein